MSSHKRPAFFPAALVWAVAICSSIISSGGVNADEWPAWRGSGQRGFSPEKNLPAKWSQKGDNLLWKNDVGARSAPVAWDGRIYVLHLTGKDDTWQEEVVCLDGENGKILWRYAFNIFLTDISGRCPSSTLKKMKGWELRVHCVCCQKLRTLTRL